MNLKEIDREIRKSRAYTKELHEKGWEEIKHREKLWIMRDGLREEG